MAATHAHDCAMAARLAQLLSADEVDAALDAGLMAFVPCPACPAPAARILQATQARLQAAWDARARHQARAARLARIAAEREARRRPAATEDPGKKPALPPAAAAILARAKAKAAGKANP